MARAYTLNIAADTRAVKVGIDKGVIDPLEDALDVLEDIGRDGGRDLDKLEDAARDSQDATEKVKKEFSDLAKEIRDTGRKAKGDFAKPMEDAADDSSEALGQLKDDAFANSKEVAASFDGSAESIVEGFQGAAAEAFSGFGPAGAVAGLLAAAGLGLALQAVTEQQEAAEELKQALIDAYKSAAAEGRAYLDQATIDAAVLDILFDAGKRAAAIADAEKIGVDSNTYIRALAGDGDALKYSLDQAQQASADLVDELDSARGGESWSPAVQAIDRVKANLEKLDVAHAENQDAAEQYGEIVTENEVKNREQIRKTRAADQARYEAAASRYGQPLPTAVVPVTADTSAADRAMRDFTSRRYRLKVDIEGRLENGQRVI